MEFRHEIQVKEPDDAKLFLSVDSNYALWINGSFVDCGQFHDFPDLKTYDTLDVSSYIRQGRNVIALLAYYQGEGSFQYIKGTPGLIYVLQAGNTRIASGVDTYYRRSRNYVCGPVTKITGQLGFTWEYDARSEDNWRGVDYVMDENWRQIAGNDCEPAECRALFARPVKKLTFLDRLSTRVAAQGVFIRKAGDSATVAQSMQTDYLSCVNPNDMFGGQSPAFPSDSGVKLDVSLARGADGIYLVVDLGREEVGFLYIDLDAPAGTVLDTAWGEHLDDLRVRARVGERNFAARYICADGRRSFIHPFTRTAGRYLQIHISNVTGDLTVHYAGLVPVEYPLGLMQPPVLDNLHAKIYDTCVRTLHLCMHEHYEDCPWREQGLYAMDMRNQALAGYHCFSEYDFPAASLDLLAKSVKADGFLELCAPAEIPITIPVFTFAWILAVSDHYKYSGDIDTLKCFYPIVKTILDKRINSTEDGLLPSPLGTRYWHFYDWAEGLDGCEKNDCNVFSVLDSVRYDAPYNLFFILALDAASTLAQVLGDDDFGVKYKSIAHNLRVRVHNTFWDNQGSYLTYSDNNTHRCELVQALAVLAEVCPADVADALRKMLASDDNGLVKTTLSYSLYKFEAMLTDADSYKDTVFEQIARDWGHMLMLGATSFWETLKGSSDFDNAGSLCHGWSGIPAYFYHKYC